jgi:ribonuclease P protein component
MERQYRLRDSRDFAHLRAEGQSYSVRGLLVSVAPNRLEHNRYGFVTSKALGGAVVRNRMRRVLREVVRAFHPQLQPGYDVALIARSALVQQPFTEVQRSVRVCLERAGIIGVESKPS